MVNLFCLLLVLASEQEYNKRDKTSPGNELTTTGNDTGGEGAMRFRRARTAPVHIGELVDRHEGVLLVASSSPFLDTRKPLEQRTRFCLPAEARGCINEWSISLDCVVDRIRAFHLSEYEEMD